VGTGEKTPAPGNFKGELTMSVPTDIDRELAKKAAGMDWPDKCSVLKAMLEEALRPKLVELEEEDYFEFSGFFNDDCLEIRDKTGGLRGGFIFNDLHQLKLFVREVVKRWTDKDPANEPVEMKIDF
jgi:hypothetical protein